ncbi:MAG: glycerophosphodiester phosphodiesterase, partial [Chloroflexota bacterium]|nr:glycerophosphodiester phosphodiesterase [Chloroflexota bacterium]
PVQLHVETKHPSRFGPRVEGALLDALAWHGLTCPRDPDRARVWVMSFSLVALRRVHAAAPALPTVLLATIWRTRLIPPSWVSAVGPSLAGLRRDPGPC